MAFDVVALGGPFGVEVRGLDLSEALDGESRRRLRGLFDDHHLLLFRGQELSGDDQLRLCRSVRPVVDDVAWVSNVEPGFHPEGELQFHCDYAFTDHPMLGLSLYAIELAEQAAPTRFASNARGLQTLPESLRRRVDGLLVVHAIDSVHGQKGIRTRLADVGGDSERRDIYPRSTRPAVWTHPVTGARLLFVLEQQASHFEGWSGAESDDLLNALFAHLYAPANVYEHHWEVGDLAVWDNLVLQHGRRANPNTVRRSLRRVAMNTVTTAELIAGTGYDPAWRQRAEQSA
jgi:taurine dioxygenase